MAEKKTQSTSDDSQEAKDTSTQSSGEKSPESLLASVRSGVSVMEASGGQLPVQITGFREDPVYQRLTPTVWATPTSALDGGDGSHASADSKLTDYVWKPFVAPDSWPMESDFNSDGTIWNDTPYGQTQNANNNTATIAGNSLTKF